MPIIPVILAILKSAAIIKVIKLLFSLALIAWFFDFINVPAQMLGFDWPLKEYFAPIFHYLGVGTGLSMIASAYTARWTFEAFRMALK
jgi:hypothetical protein